MSGRDWIGEAVAALDQSLEAIPEGEWGSPDYWASRANAAASIASAEQARISNLIAWKALQATRAASNDQGLGLPSLGAADDVADEIEQALGIADEPPAEEPS